MKIKSWFWYLLAAVATLVIRTLLTIDIIPLSPIGNIDVACIKKFVDGICEVPFCAFFVYAIFNKATNFTFQVNAFGVFVVNLAICVPDIFLNNFAPTSVMHFIGLVVGYIVLVAGYYIVKAIKNRK